MSMKKSTVAAIVVAFLGSAVYGAQLPESLTLKAYEEVSYNDNIFYSPSGQEARAMINRTGLKLGYSRMKGDLSFDVKAKVEDVRYNGFHSMEHIAYDFIPQMKYDQGNWNLTLGGRFSYTIAPVDTTNLDQYKIYSNGMNALWDLSLNERWGVAVDGSVVQSKFTGALKAHYLDNNEFVVGIAPYYRISPKTKFGLHTGYGTKIYDTHIQQTDSQWVFGNAFIDHQVTGKVALRIEGGVVSRWYDGEGNVDDSSWTGANASVSLNYKATNSLEFNLAYMHRPSDIYSQIIANDAKRLKVSDEVGLGAIWEINSQIELEQRISYALNDDKSGSTLDNLNFGYDINLRYKIGQHAEVSVGYEYNNVDYTTRFGTNYDQNIVKAGFSWQF